MIVVINGLGLLDRQGGMEVGEEGEYIPIATLSLSE